MYGTRPPCLAELWRDFRRDSPDLALHGRRVGAYAVVIGRRVGGVPLRRLYRAGQFHDFGKGSIPDAILNKPEALTEEEYAAVCRHPRWGESLLAAHWTRDRIVLDGVRHHHERYDGDGYPDGLHAQAIPLVARILAVADTIDAMASPRPYRPGQSWYRVLRELEIGWATQFDPDVVDAALSVEAELYALYLRFTPAAVRAA